jgi:N-acetylneuraminic acid mutarotase
MRSRFSAIAAALLALSCLDGGTAPQGAGPLSFRVVNGNNQSGPAGAELPTALVVQVFSAGVPVPDLVLSYRVSGGGSVFADATSTDAQGKAKNWWTLGTNAAEPQGVEVRAVLASGTKVVAGTFTATALPGPAAQIARSAGDGQTAFPGISVPIAPAVLVTDQYGNPVAGVTVTFAAGNGGSVTGESQTTGTDGIATVGSWTLGAAGPNTLTGTATGSGIAGNPVTFTATAGAGPPASIVIHAGNGQTAAPGATVPIRPAVRVTNQQGSPVPGVTVTFTAANGGTVTGATQTTNANGVATVGAWTLGAAGANTLTATATGSGIAGNPVTFTATAVAPAGSWSTRASITPRTFLGAGVVGGTLYAVGGSNNAGPQGTLEAYDPTANTWTPRASMPTPRERMGVGVVNGILYTVGGVKSGVDIIYVPTVQAYDPAQGAWSTKAPISSARFDVGVGVINGLLYAVGGENLDGAYSKRLEAYDPTTNTWTIKAPMPTGRKGHAVAVVNGMLYAIGGFHLDPVHGIGLYLSTVEAYDPATNTWSTKAPMPTPRVWTSAGVVNGIIYVVGGANGPGVATVEAYDPATNTWSTKTAMPSPRLGLAAGVLDGVLYAIGGQLAAFEPRGTVEAYQP